MLIRKLSMFFVGLLTATQALPVRAQSLYYGVAQSDQGGRYKLVTHRTGNGLRFDISATSAQTSLAGTPNCDPTTVDATGRFMTWCGKFQAQDGGRVPLEGNLNQLTARIGPVFRFGSATFKLDTYTPGTFPGR